MPEREGGGDSPPTHFSGKVGVRQKEARNWRYVRVRRRGKVAVGRVSVLLSPPERESEGQGPSTHSDLPTTLFWQPEKVFFKKKIVRKGKGRGAALKKKTVGRNRSFTRYGERTFFGVPGYVFLFLGDGKSRIFSPCKVAKMSRFGGKEKK